MNEDLLHFVWRFQYLKRKPLLTTCGSEISIFNPGIPNTNSGPDFLDASIKIGGIQWHGYVELHVNTSDWVKHNHSADPAYKNVILHVVWENDIKEKKPEGLPEYLLTLHEMVSPEVFNKYHHLKLSAYSQIPCESKIDSVSELIKMNMLERACIERLNTKSKQFDELVTLNQGDKEESVYQFLGRGFGFKINKYPMLELCRLVPLKLLKRSQYALVQIEALLFGQAGFLEGIPTDSYMEALQKEYQFLKKKYVLQPALELFQWKFHRLRPANFPTLRIAQFAAFICKHGSGLYGKFLYSPPKELVDCFDVAPSSYWLSHYHFGKESPKSMNRNMGSQSRNSLIINTLAPVLSSYALEKDDYGYTEKAIDVLSTLPPERNSEIDKVKAIWELPTNAFDTQGMLEIYGQYCTKKKCMECAIGNALIAPLESQYGIQKA